MKNKLNKCLIAALTVIAALGAAPAALAIPTIRDAEIENTVREMASPVITAAGLNESAVKFYIVNDDAINAFVAGGQNIFIHTGLILQSDKPEALIGVIAHEAGHIAGGHLARGAEAADKFVFGGLTSYLLAAAAAASGQGQIAGALASAGTQFAERSFLSYSRAQEQAADQAALAYLSDSRISPEGLLDILQMLGRKEGFEFGSQTPYLRTHPLSIERISNIRSYLGRNGGEYGMPEEIRRKYAMMIAKLRGFLRSPAETTSFYKDDKSDAATYARAIAYFRSSDLKRALEYLDTLIKKSPNNAYFLELKGQFLYENGRVEEAKKYYRQAVSLMPDEPLMRMGLALACLASEKPQDATEAVENLERARRQEKPDAMLWRHLATAYGRKGDKGMFHLALAEEAALLKKKEESIRQAKLAKQELKEDAPAWRRAEELVTSGEWPVDR